MTDSRKGTHAEHFTRHDGLWCDDCGRAHNGTETDALRILGDRDAFYRDAHACERTHAYTVIAHGTRRITPNGRVPALYFARTRDGRTLYAHAHTTPIRAREVGRATGRTRIGVSLGYCDACGVTRKEHTPNDGHTYRAAMGARVTGDVRTGTFADSHNARVRALVAR